MKIKLLYILIITPFCLSSCVRGQNNNFDKQIMDMLNKFYTEHNSVWSKSPPDFEVLSEKLDSLNAVYCTSALRKEAEKALEGEYGQDILTKGNPGIYSFENLRIEKDTTLVNTYIVYYTTLYYDASVKLAKANVVLHVSVVEEGDDYKINEVK